MRKKWIRKLIEACCVLAVTYLAAMWSLRYAYQTRGYEAVGGEYLFILMVCRLSYRAVAGLFDALERKRTSPTRAGRSH